jgi:LPXTG-site transpeptidase (sortase) family protein
VKDNLTESLRDLSKKKKNRKARLAGLLLINSVFIVALIALSVVYGPLIYAEIRYSVGTLFDENIKNSGAISKDLPRRVTSGEDILLEPVNKIPEPVDKDFSLIITKIGVNKKVIQNVDLSNDAEVQKALSEGIGWAKGTVEPGEFGNSLLFAHSTRNTWDIWRYNSEFTLLDKLTNDDMFSIVYKGRQFDFLVFEKVIVPANDTSYLTSVAEGRIVTLQTCYPPGSDSGRQLVRGRLIAMQTI